MKIYNIKDKKVQLHNIVCAITSEPDWEMKIGRASCRERV